MYFSDRYTLDCVRFEGFQKKQRLMGYCYWLLPLPLPLPLLSVPVNNSDLNIVIKPAVRQLDCSY